HPSATVDLQEGWAPGGMRAMAVDVELEIQAPDAAERDVFHALHLRVANRERHQNLFPVDSLRKLALHLGPNLGAIVGAEAFAECSFHYFGGLARRPVAEEEGQPRSDRDEKSENTGPTAERAHADEEKSDGSLHDHVVQRELERQPSEKETDHGSLRRRI